MFSLTKIKINNISYIKFIGRLFPSTRLVSGLDGTQDILQFYKREINDHGKKDQLPTEFQNEFEPFRMFTIIQLI